MSASAPAANDGVQGRPDAAPTLRLSLRSSAISPREREAFQAALATLRLPKARVGTPYNARLDLGATLAQSAPEVRDATFALDRAAGFAELGLTLRLDADVPNIPNVPNVPDVLRFVGTPPRETASDARIELEICVDGATFASTALPWRVLPDVWSLWKNLPSPSGPYPVEDQARQAVSVPKTDKIVVAASQRGRSHEHRGQFREDAFAVKIGKPGDWSFFAVADGAGSAKFSRQGAKLACETVVAQLARHIDLSCQKGEIPSPLFAGRLERRKDAPRFALYDGTQAPPALVAVFHRALYETFMRVVAERDAYNQTLSADESPVRLRDFYSTLLCCAVRKYRSGWAILSYWVGDGAFAIYGPGGDSSQVVPLGEPDGGEFAGQTRFFTTASEIALESIQRRFRAAVLRDFDALVMATDGVADPYFEVAADLRSPQKWRKFWSLRGPEELFDGVFERKIAPEERARRLLKGLRFKVSGNHDDRALLLLFNPDRFADDVASRNRPRS